MALSEIFSNREIAAGVWLIIVMIWMLWHPKLRRAFVDLPRAFLRSKLIVTWVAMSAYIGALVWLLSHIGIRDAATIKDLVIWSLGMVGILINNITEVSRSRDSRILRKMIIESFQLAAILQFVVSLHSFSLLAELILLPAGTFIGLMLAVAELKPEHAGAARVMRWAMGLMGAAILILTGRSIVDDPSSFLVLENVVAFMLPIALTILFMPFFYGLALRIAYSAVYTHLEVFNNDPELVRFMKRRVLLRFRWNLNLLNRWFHDNRVLRFNTKDEILRSLRQA